MTLPLASDASLLERIRVGDEAALSELLVRHAPTVLRFARKLCGSEPEAEDVVQETLLAATRGLQDLRGDAAVSTWLYTVARNACIKKRRRSKHAPSALVSLDVSEPPAPVETQPDVELARRELGAALQAAIDELEPNVREVLVLRDVEGLSAAEVARVLETSVDAVKSRLHRARAAVRASLATELGEDVPTVPSDPACPDITLVLSRHLEGDVSRDACAAMESHVAHCGSCSAACGSLRRAVALCAMGRDDVPSEQDARRIRRIVERVVAESKTR